MIPNLQYESTTVNSSACVPKGKIISENTVLLCDLLTRMMQSETIIVLYVWRPSVQCLVFHITHHGQNVF